MQNEGVSFPYMTWEACRGQYCLKACWACAYVTVVEWLQCEKNDEKWTGILFLVESAI